MAESSATSRARGDQRNAARLLPTASSGSCSKETSGQAGDMEVADDRRTAVEKAWTPTSSMHKTEGNLVSELCAQP